MINTYEQAQRFSHKQLGQYLIIQDAFSVYGFKITSFTGFEPDTLEYLDCFDKHKHPEVTTYDQAYDLLFGKPQGKPDFVNTITV